MRLSTLRSVWRMKSFGGDSKYLSSKPKQWLQIKTLSCVDIFRWGVVNGEIQNKEVLIATQRRSVKIFGWWCHLILYHRVILKMGSAFRMKTPSSSRKSNLCKSSCQTFCLLRAIVSLLSISKAAIMCTFLLLCLSAFDAMPNKFVTCYCSLWYLCIQVFLIRFTLIVFSSQNVSIMYMIQI